MNFNKFGWYLVYLGGIFGLVAALFAWMPHNMRWEHYEAIRSATFGGDTSTLFRIERQFEIYGMVKIGFAIACAITLFIGAAMILSSGELSPDDTKECPHCKESIKLDALICKHCGKEQPPEDPNAKLNWTCPSCNAISKGHMTKCGVCDKPRPDDVVFKAMTRDASK